MQSPEKYSVVIQTAIQIETETTISLNPSVTCKVRVPQTPYHDTTPYTQAHHRSPCPHALTTIKSHPLIANIQPGRTTSRASLPLPNQASVCNTQRCKSARVQCVGPVGARVVTGWGVARLGFRLQWEVRVRRFSSLKRLKLISFVG